MKKVLGVTILVLAFTCDANADLIADGDLGDWGVTPGSDWHNGVGANEWIEPEVGSNGYVGPGYGGQTYNVEAVYARADTLYLYYAVVTGFPDVSQHFKDETKHPGDVFLDVAPLYTPSGSDEPTGRMTFAIETTTYDKQHKKGGLESQGQGAGSFYADVGLVLADDRWDGVYYPVGIKRTGSKKLADGTFIGMTDFAYNDDFYGANHYVIEGRVPLAYFGDVGIDGAVLSWTMTCANDIGSVGIDMPVYTNPEPGTLVLLGSGALLGVGVWQRRRMK